MFKSNYKHARESKLLRLIGHAEMEIEKTVKEITQCKDSLERETNIPIEFDKKVLKKYVDFVLRNKKEDSRK